MFIVQIQYQAVITNHKVSLFTGFTVLPLRVTTSGGRVGVGGTALSRGTSEIGVLGETGTIGASELTSTLSFTGRKCFRFLRTDRLTPVGSLTT